ncbi:tyrosine phosphatase family protein [Roseomonas populi]|uniref:Tyrosine specific protein phosphatases domain-containing protein n=1 Tax=Roseomonas populi TaxID=3121582 RepID=A0ABT1XA88_9PROT|nr:hypothetical protein [Roseomonas pecuniae]MCR0985020.1 hypothetical protein [Roseomonas pecuniae]
MHPSEPRCGGADVRSSTPGRNTAKRSTRTLKTIEKSHDIETIYNEPLGVSARTWARRHGHAFPGVITVEDPDQPASDLVRFEQQPPDHLVLRFVDLDSPAPSPHTGLPRFRMADEADLERALAFGRAKSRARLLVHCNAGIGRSTAVAFAILADRLGPGQEQQALDEVLRIRPQAVPNLHVVDLADRVLGRGGELVRVVAAWDAARPDNARHRSYNRLAHFVFNSMRLDPGH